MSTTPFPGAVAAVVTGSHRQRLTVTVQAPTGPPFELDVEDYSITWDERRAPRVTAEIRCTLTSEIEVNNLDPRLDVTGTFVAGYYLPSTGQWSDRTVAVLHLRRRTINRPSNTVTLNFASLEALIIDASPSAGNPDDGTTATQTIPQWIAQQIEYIFEDTPSEGVPITITHPSTATNQYIQLNTDKWDEFENAALTIDADIYDDGMRRLRITPQPVPTVPVHALTVGEYGTILSSDATIDREDWANWVVIKYGDPNGLQVWGSAGVTAGPYTPFNPAHIKQHTLERKGYPPQLSANAAARSVLRRMLSRSRSYSLDAVAAWWVRPGQTVTVALPASPATDHLVSSVTFRTGWRMSLTTRLPDTASTIGE